MICDFVLVILNIRTLTIFKIDIFEEVSARLRFQLRRVAPISVTVTSIPKYIGRKGIVWKNNLGILVTVTEIGAEGGGRTHMVPGTAGF